MDRRGFLRLAAATPPALSPAAQTAAPSKPDAPKGPPPVPAYKVITKFKPTGNFGMPGPYPARVAAIHHARSVDEQTERVDAAAVRDMLRTGITSLTGDRDARDAWARFFTPEDVVGIKINASGAPGICSTPEVVWEIARNLTAVGVKPDNIWIHERNKNQVDTVPYASGLPAGAHVITADAFMGYDPFTYVEVNFFGEDDTRSNMVRLVTDRLTKIINVPNMKDHSASGVTGCLKNIAYGEFHNVARSHEYADTHTLSFIGVLAAVEPLRSRTVLHIMDGLRGVWHAGPFSPDRRYRFYPKQIMFGTDPVAMDRLLLDVIDGKRRAEGAISVWDRSPKYMTPPGDSFRRSPNLNRFYREPGHIEYASRLGLGTYDKEKIKVSEVRL
jgi:uncharacterized protein (DUF362 family)